MKPKLLALALALVVWGVPAAVAEAWIWPKNPHTCSYGEGVKGRPSQCSRDAARFALRQHIGDAGNGGLYPGRTTCRHTATPLRFVCRARARTYSVVFRRIRGRWWVLVKP
jgi:hypothetical protein